MFCSYASKAESKQSKVDFGMFFIFRLQIFLMKIMTFSLSILRKYSFVIKLVFLTFELSFILMSFNFSGHWTNQAIEKTS